MRAGPNAHGSGEDNRVDDRPFGIDRRARARFLLGTLSLAIALVATAVLAADAVLLLTPPGCGEDSGCARAARSAWATVPVVEWPVSVLALAWFLALAVGWATPHRDAPAFRRIVRIGALGSLAYLAALVAGGYLCPWCLAAHAGSFGLLAVLETGTPRRGARAPLGAMAVLFVVVGAALLATRAAVVRGKVEAPRPAASALTTRYPGRDVDGPEIAPIRIVAYSDYQCPDCRRIESAIRDLVETRSDVAVMSKHFPMCADCNRHVTRTLHANACWAARAAEAAAILHGPAGRRLMHRWLFDRGGSFTDAEIRTAIVELGWNPREFLEVMQSDRTLEIVRRDVEEAKALGVFFTPLVFVNGVELKWRSGRALESLVTATAANDPEPRRFDEDPLPLAAGKIVTDWAAGEVRTLDAAAGAPSLGREDAPVRVVVWGDLEEPNTARLHARLRARIAERADVRYRFLHYPLDSTCNPAASSTRHQRACLAACASEAARLQSGDPGFWATLEWLLAHPGGVTEEALGAAAGSLGLDRDRFLSDLRSAEVGSAVAGQCRAAAALGVRFVPMVWINGRLAERWQAPDGEHDALELLLDAVAATARDDTAAVNAP